MCQKRSDVTFVGIGRGEMMDELNALVEALGVTGRVRFVGQKYDIHRWLAAADIFCFTTNYEGFPNAVLEAMLAGLPVVCTTFAGVDEVIASPDMGILVPLNNDKAMAQQIIALLDDPDRRHRLGAAAKSAAIKQFTWEPLVATMESLYSELLDNGENCSCKV